MERLIKLFLEINSFDLGVSVETKRNILNGKQEEMR